jgi:YVTN family beta-propeller protein
MAAASLAAALVPADGSAAAAASTGYTVSLVPVPDGGTKVAVDTATNTVYLTDGSQGHLIVVNGATGSVETTLSLGSVVAQDVAVDQATGMIYVSEERLDGLANVVVVNGGTNTVAATIAEPANSNPIALATDDATDTVYVANDFGHNVTVIDGKTNTISATISTGSASHPYAVAVDESTDTAWVADYSGSVTEINGATNTIADALALPVSHVDAIAVDPATNTVYTGGRSAEIYVIDGAAATLAATIKTPYVISGVAADPVAGVVYATSPGATWAIDASTNTITDTLTRGGASVAVAATPGSAYEAGASGYGLWLLTPSAANAMSPVINSQTDAIFSTGTAGSATIQASALPAATFSESGALPAGLTFSSDGTISGTPAAGTGGFYPVTITADNGVAPDFSQSFGVAVDQPIVITSASHATFQVGDVSSFTFASSGYPTPSYQVTGTLPAGVTLLWSQANGWQLTGSPMIGSGGVYPLTIHALDGNGGDITQSFTLTVLEPPLFTSKATAVFRAGHSGAFTVSADGYPAPSFTATGTVPSWAKLAVGGVLRAAPPAHAGGAYHFTISARNGIGSAVTQAVTLEVDQPPAITSARRATFRAGHRSTFRFRSTGFPDAKLSERGHLPSGVRFVRERNGTAILTGKAARGAKGRTYKITITAANGVGPAVHQTFWLKVS